MSSRRCRNHPSSRTYRSMPSRGGLLGQREQRVEVVVEVDRLPGVEQHLARRVAGAPAGPAGAGGSAPEKLVEPLAPGADQPGRGVALAVAEPDLAGQQQLAAAQQPPAGEGVLGAQHLVAAPGQVHAPDPAGAEAEPGPTRAQHRGGVVPGTAAPGLAHPLALGRTARRCGVALVGVPPGHVQQLVGLGRHRQRGLQVRDLVRSSAAGSGRRRAAAPDRSPSSSSSVVTSRAPGPSVPTLRSRTVPVGRPRLPRRGSTASKATDHARPARLPEQAGTPDPAGRVLRQHAPPRPGSSPPSRRTASPSARHQSPQRRRRRGRRGRVPSAARRAGSSGSRRTTTLVPPRRRCSTRRRSVSDTGSLPLSAVPSGGRVRIRSRRGHDSGVDRHEAPRSGARAVEPRTTSSGW